MIMIKIKHTLFYPKKVYENTTAWELIWHDETRTQAWPQMF